MRSSLLAFCALALFACKGDPDKVCPEPTPMPSCSCPPAAPQLGAMPLDVPKAGELGEPQAADADAEASKPILAVTIDASGNVYVGADPAPNDAALQSLLKKHGAPTRATILADATVQHGRVMHVLDQLKMAGVTKISFGVSPSK